MKVYVFCLQSNLHIQVDLREAVSLWILLGLSPCVGNSKPMNILACVQVLCMRINNLLSIAALLNNKGLSMLRSLYIENETILQYTMF